MKKILLVLAHPDDESFLCGGTVVKYIKSGWEVELVCATNGEKGEIGLLENVTPNELGNIRQKELTQACKILGINKIMLLEYPDLGLDKTIPGDIEDRLFKIFTESVPDIIITFDTSGITNHPDHMRLSYATTFAFQKYASWIEETLLTHVEKNPEVLPKLYYSCFPENTIKFLKTLKVLPSDSFGKPWKGVVDKAITTVVDIKDVASNKIAALKCHQSQSNDVNKFLAIPGLNPFLKHEYYVLRMHGQKEIFMGKNDRVSGEL